MRPALVIGCGNTLRSDDGVGWCIAEALDQRALPGLEVAAVHQLTPELAPRIAAAAAVVFVDAGLAAPRPLALQPLAPAPAGQPFSHQLTPQALLALGRQLYGRQPPAWQLLIPVQELAIGCTLSAAAAQAQQEALTLLQRWAAAPLAHA
jgi:hydrogenase maturation protease